MENHLTEPQLDMLISSSPAIYWEVVSRESDLYKYGYIHLDSVYYSKSLKNKLPRPLNRKSGLQGKWLFCYPGNSSVSKMTIQKEFTQVLNKSPAFMYFQYYIHLGRNNLTRNKGNPKLFVLPAMQRNHEMIPNQNQVALLPESKDFEWTEAVVEIDVNFVVNNIYGIEFGTEDLQDGDLFVLKKLAIVYGKDSQGIEDFRTHVALIDDKKSTPEILPPEQQSPQPVAPITTLELEESCCGNLCDCILSPLTTLSLIAFQPFIWCRNRCFPQYRNYNGV